MFFASDNTGPVHPAIMTALQSANAGHEMPYGVDPIMESVRAEIRRIFEAPEAAVYLVATGTAANALALACYTQPWQTIFCAPTAHIQEDECNAPEFYCGGAKLSLVGKGDKITPDELSQVMRPHLSQDVHRPQAGALSITQVTERGGVYSLAEIRALTDVAKAHNLPVHLDGARFANAIAALGCTPAEMSWKSQVDVVSFGGTKNGCMGVEAVIFFDPEKAWEFELRRKRAAHLFSKHRYLSAQMLGYLKEDLWLTTAQMANDNAAYLAEGLRQRGADFIHPGGANMLFPCFARQIHQKLLKAGAQYHLWHVPLEGPADEVIPARMVCDWSLSRDQIDAFLALF